MEILGIDVTNGAHSGFRGNKQIAEDRMKEIGVQAMLRYQQQKQKEKQQYAIAEQKAEIQQLNQDNDKNILSFLQKGLEKKLTDKSTEDYNKFRQFFCCGFYVRTADYNCGLSVGYMNLPDTLTYWQDNACLSMLPDFPTEFEKNNKFDFQKKGDMMMTYTRSFVYLTAHSLWVNFLKASEKWPGIGQQVPFNFDGLCNDDEVEVVPLYAIIDDKKMNEQTPGWKENEQLKKRIKCVGETLRR